MEKSSVFPYNTALKKSESYDENYFDTHTNGIDDRLLIAAGVKNELAVWKKLDRRRNKLSFSKYAFLGGAGAWLSSGMPCRSLIFMLINIIIVNISVQYAMVISDNTPEMETFRAMTPPKYTVSEVSALIDAQTADFSDIEKQLFMQALAYGKDVYPGDTAERFNKYRSIVKSKAYKELYKEKDLAMEYEHARRLAEESKRLIIKPVAVIFLYVLQFGFNFLISVFFNYAYSQTMRRKILSVMASHDVIDSEEQFLELLRFDDRRSRESAMILAAAVDFLYYAMPIIAIIIGKIFYL